VPRRNAEFDRLVTVAEAHGAGGRFEEAEAAYCAALAILPSHPSVLHNLGVIAARRGDLRAAIAYLDAALLGDPRYASAHYNRAVVLETMGLRDKAIEAFARALAYDPEFYAAHRAIGLCLLADGNCGRALDHFARTYELRRSEDRTGIAAKSLRSANRTKLRHDAEQFRYLARVGRDPRRFAALASSYETVGRDFAASVTPLSEADLVLLGESYNTAIHLAEAPEISEDLLGPQPGRDALVKAFRGRRAGAVYFDNLLSPPAFASLRRYLLESTIWHDFSHVAGFVATYLEDGLACPLLLQIANELRRVFPELLGPHPLSQAWAFKGMDPTTAIDVHGDDAAISLNFWMTPDEANRDVDRGGLAVCLAPPPPGWAPTGYEHDRQRSVHFLEQCGQDMLFVPYRENRAVLFASRLLHYSDAPNFVEGYENHRISVTLLFGRALTTDGAQREEPAEKFSGREGTPCP